MQLLILSLIVWQTSGTCPVTQPTDGLLYPPAPYPVTAPYGQFWHGTSELWTMLPRDGAWNGLRPYSPDVPGLRQKVFWWYPGFVDARQQPTPDLKVTARRLDAPGRYVHRAPATNAYHRDFGGWAILTGIDLPAHGCWEITGWLHERELSFVVWVGP